MREFFKDIPKIKYEGKDSKNPLSFKFYEPDRVIRGKTMREHLRFAMSYWHTLCGEGIDMFGAASMDKSFGGANPMETAKLKAYAAFEILDKLDIDFYCFHDRDVAPEGDTLVQTNKNLKEIVKLLKQLQQDYNKKLLWGTAKLFEHPRYMNGAATSPSADVFCYAAAQVKEALDATLELSGEGYVFWGGREGYETLLNTDMKLELDNLARFLKMSVDYAKSIGFEGDFYIEPKPKEPTKHQYDFDAATVIGFLKSYELDQYFKLNIEANHATLAGHTFQHELRVAKDNNMFGSIDANQGDTLLGWDTDQFPTDVYQTTLCMYEVLSAGGFTKGGLNFDAKARRSSNTFKDIFISHIAGMDAFAIGLIAADKIISDGRIDSFVVQRYQSYSTGIGKKIVEGKTNLKELAEIASTLDEIKVESGSQEYLESIINQILFS
ncbi:MAG TPA: xylose isomerase [Clostridiales bacterium]|jgi:xylose isomerase|nr:xylose isomerase [Clostridiales bacterium]